MLFSNCLAPINRHITFFLILLVSSNVIAQESPAKKAQTAIPASGLLVMKNGEVIKLKVTGHHSLEKQTAFTSDSPFRIASNTKPYTAATIFRLMEENQLQLNDAIKLYLPKKFVAKLELAGYNTNEIQIQHLLGHTAGLRDHSTAKEYLQAVFANPDYRWRPQQQIKMMAELGEPLNNPGEAYVYSDTGYVLLGQIIENVARMTLSSAVRHYLNFEKLGLKYTWWEFYEAAPENAPKRIHQYLGGTDTLSWHPSVDLYGGGGLLSSLKDMASFTEQLLNGKVFENRETLKLMLNTSTHPAPDEYRYGILVKSFGDHKALGHSGFWGTVSFYLPKLDITVAGVVSEQSGYKDMLANIEKLIAELKPMPSIH